MGGKAGVGVELFLFIIFNFKIKKIKKKITCFKGLFAGYRRSPPNFLIKLKKLNKKKEIKRTTKKKKKKKKEIAENLKKLISEKNVRVVPVVAAEKNKTFKIFFLNL
ncbi:MAG: hypothetical protein IPL84_00680 [Chitinophagaceae bacterium]|nr:hypothetical protein [Chitinophagaceae bacterium]